MEEWMKTQGHWFVFWLLLSKMLVAKESLWPPVLETWPSDQNVVTQAHLPFGICPWLLRNSNRTFPHDLNEVFSWDLQGQRSRFGWLPWIHTHLKRERINMIVSWLFWLFSLALYGLIFRKMEEFSNTGWADGSDVGESPYIKGQIMFNAGGNRSSSFREILVR